MKKKIDFLWFNMFYNLGALLLPFSILYAFDINMIITIVISLLHYGNKLDNSVTEDYINYKIDQLNEKLNSNNKRV